ncbi:unnamed protein product [Ectocarpus sp. CCAP 1310/34]|nr:unnamed protein product [Ectocarpus sp. CCAP 1310/34]
MAEATGIHADVREVKRDLASVRESVEDCRAENMVFFASFTAGLEAARQGIELMRVNAPLEEAQMALKNFEASKGNVRFLETAHSKAMTALVQGHTLDVKLNAAVIAVSAGYVHMSKVDCPSEAKDFTVNGTLANVVSHFAPTWSDPSCASTADGKKTVSFLLNIVSCVLVLPPESASVLSNLDERILPAFCALCSAEPELRCMYPKVAGAVVGAMLEQKTMRDLFHLADMVGVDVESCTSHEAMVQVLLSSGKALLPGPVPNATTDRSALMELFNATNGSSWTNKTVPNATTDRSALMELFNATNGSSWTNKTGWGTSTPLQQWHGVTVDGAGRVTTLDLSGNNLSGVSNACIESPPQPFLTKVVIIRNSFHLQHSSVVKEWGEDGSSQGREAISGRVWMVVSCYVESMLRVIFEASQVKRFCEFKTGVELQGMIHRRSLMVLLKKVPSQRHDGLD